MANLFRYAFGNKGQSTQQWLDQRHDRPAMVCYPDHKNGMECLSKIPRRQETDANIGWFSCLRRFVVFKVDENGAESSILPMLPMLALLRRSQHVSKCLFDCCKNPNLLQVIVFGCLSSDRWISAWWQVDFGLHLPMRSRCHKGPPHMGADRLMLHVSLKNCTVFNSDSQ